MEVEVTINELEDEGLFSRDPCFISDHRVIGTDHLPVYVRGVEDLHV